MEKEQNVLVIKNEIQAGKIVHNYIELKAKVALMVQPFVGTSVTVDTQKEASKTLANLRKLDKGLNSERINLKKQWMAPYLSVEALMKEVISVVNKPIVEISSQLKVFEEAEKQAKKEAIDELKAKLLADSPLVEYIHGLKWFDDDRWMNKSYTLPKIEKEIIKEVSDIENAVDLLRENGGEFANRMISEFAKDGDVVSALNSGKRMQAEKDAADKAAEAMRQRELEKAELARVAEIPRPLPNFPKAEIKPEQTSAPQKPEPAAEPGKDLTEAEEIKTIRIDVELTKTQWTELLAYCRENRIKITPVKEEK